MLHEEILRRYFTIDDDRKGWTSLKTLSGEQLPGFKTSRIAKSETGESLHFTIGQTARGKQAGLDRIIEIIIETSGLQVLSLPSTDGRQQGQKIYKGFDLRAVDANQLEAILRRIQANIECLN